MPSPSMVVLVAVPTASRRVHSSILELVAGLQSVRPDVMLMVAVVPCISPIALARNTTVRLALENPSVTHVWTIDDDVVVADDAHRLLMSDADITSARVPVWLGRPGEDGAVHHRVTVPAGRCSPEPGKFDFVHAREEGRVAIDACGLGCAVIRRRVLEDPRMHLGLSDGCPVLFRTIYGPDGGVLVGEDIDFTSRARQLGHRIVLDGGVRCGHEKTVDLAEVEKWATRRRPGLAVRATLDTVEADPEVARERKVSGG